MTGKFIHTGQVILDLVMRVPGPQPEQPATVVSEISRLSMGEETCIEGDMNRRNLLRALGLGAASLSPFDGPRDLVLDAAHTSALLTASMETHGVSHRVLTYARSQLATWRLTTP